MNLVGVNSPVRLLREKWASPVELAQELYAMFTAKGPTELQDTLTIKVPQGRTALRIEQSEGDTSHLSITHGGIAKNSVSTAPSVPGRRQPPTREESSRRPDSGAPAPATSLQPTPLSGSSASSPGRRVQAESPGVEIGVPVKFSTRSPVSFSQPPVVTNPVTGQRDEVMTKSQTRRDDVTTYTPIFGIVQEGTGDTYQVQFFPSGFDGPGTSTNYAVKVPSVNADQQIPAGTKLFPIWLFQGVYYHQPPVWL